MMTAALEKTFECIQKREWEAATEWLQKEIAENGMSEYASIALASLNEYFGNRNELFENIRTGLRYNIQSYELYLMLGDYYLDENVNLAYLCYENAEYYCEKQCGTDSDDLNYILMKKRAVAQEYPIDVKKVSIIILSYNTLEDTKACIESIRQTCKKDTYEIVVVENGSVDGSLRWLMAQEDVKVVANDCNVGFPAGCNQGIRAAEPVNDIFLLNSDTIVMPNALWMLRVGLYASEKHGAVGSVTNNATNYQVIDEVFDTVEKYKAYAQINNLPNMNAYEYKAWLVGFAVLLRRDVLERVGYLDERYTPGNYEDSDLGMRILEAGYQNVLCHNSFIFHWGSRSFEKNAVNHGDAMCVNLEKFKEKWKFDIRYYTFVRMELIGYIECEREKPIRVLEVGCGMGSTLGKIKYLYPNAQVYGVELVEPVAQLAKTNFAIISGDVEQMELPYDEQSFDYIICADVLEHLHNPEKILSELRRYLKIGGCILASIPNLMNAEVVYELLKGNFTYRDSGILDKTHLHFFTLNEIQRMFIKNGFSVEKIGTMVAPEKSTTIAPEFFEQLLSISGVADRQLFDTYQFLVKANNISQ